MGSSACYVLENYGVCSPDLFPNNGQGYRTSPSKQAVAAAALTKVKAHQLADLEEVKLCHGQGFPTFFGIPVYPSFVQSAEVMATGQIPLPDPSEQLAGGHELKTVGHDDSAEILILANSWGTGVGDHGYFYLPYAYFEQYADAAYTVRLP
jgi:C1A family cysteine protease